MSADVARVTVEVPAPLRTLAKMPAVVVVELAGAGALTQRALVAALEAAYPALLGTVRDPATNERRAYLRFFANNEDISHLGLDAALPSEVLSWKSAFLIVGAVSGG